MPLPSPDSSLGSSSLFPNSNNKICSGRSPAYPEMPSSVSFCCPHAARQTVCFGCKRAAREWQACPCGSLKQKLLPESLLGEVSTSKHLHRHVRGRILCGQDCGGAGWVLRQSSGDRGFVGQARGVSFVLGDLEKRRENILNKKGK